ncbi:DUF3990 domain-containing protein [Planococcus citreus]|uniref:Uncharacterized protein DUF3990 n=1 Tax=Planococcus citreus TaxID=1373 RepID=A0A497YHN2_9BACL|nr:DUF3990 domain-containing protein [Planococcus citreus]RLJ86618.1 uncharacterized protein DUF3990 [Planococcus citreus]
MKVFNNINDIPTILYHGTLEKWLLSLQGGIILEKGNSRADFGQGFYLTANYNQARQWTRTVHSKLKRSEGIVSERMVANFFLDKKKLEGLNCLFFTEINEEWAAFIFANRKHKKLIHNNLDNKYDLVYGPLADGKISNLMDDYEFGVIETYKELMQKIVGTKYPFPQDHQISFHSKEALDALEFKRGDKCE